MNDLQKLVIDVCTCYAADPICPSILFSYVPGKGWYAVIARYEYGGARGKKNVCARFGETLEATLHALTLAFAEVTRHP